jgi:hypothetical protein
MTVGRHTFCHQRARFAIERDDNSAPGVSAGHLKTLTVHSQARFEWFFALIAIAIMHKRYNGDLARYSDLHSTPQKKNRCPYLRPIHKI